MYGVIERRRRYLKLARQYTLERGYFTTTDIQAEAGVPRSTAQDWINRLMAEGCLIQKQKKLGRHPARYAAISVLPASACTRIFTTVDGDRVEIFHECLSGACAAFCGLHHGIAGGVITKVERDGTLLRECARIGRQEIRIGLHPSPAVGISGIERKGKQIVQHIRSIGGPAYSLSDMMRYAEGVLEVKIRKSGEIVEGEVYTRALTHLVIGVDDTDSPDQGATFAVAIALLQNLGRMPGVFPISHHVVMLNPVLPEKTAGNSASYIEVAAEGTIVRALKKQAAVFMADQSASGEWGLAVKCGFTIPAELRNFGLEARSRVVLVEDAQGIASLLGVSIEGGRGKIGALAAVALSGLPEGILLRPDAPLTHPAGALLDA
jgi:hypothetical protein